MMDTNHIAAFGYAVALTVYALLTILLLSGWKRSDKSRLPALGTVVSVVWAGVWAAGFLDLTREYALVSIVEWARGLAWLVALIAIFQEVARTRLAGQLKSGYGFFVLLLAGAPVVWALLRADDIQLPIVWLAGGYVFSLLIVLAAEQLYRNSPVELRSSIVYLCIAVAGVFLFDVVMYGLVIAGVADGEEYWAARGYVNALFAAPLALGIWRRSRMSHEAQVPRQIVFYTFGITAIAIYVVLVAIGLGYIQAYGGSWSTVGGIVLVVAAIAAAVVLFASASTRARVRVFLTKTFLQYKYDYRNEWLRFIGTLSESGLENVAETAVRVVSQIVKSPGGVVYIREEESEAFLPSGQWRCAIPDVVLSDNDSGLVKFLDARQWVIDLEEMKRNPSQYEGLQLDSLLTTDSEWWLIVPLFLGKRLYGFALLLRPRVVPSLNFEDHDLLRTVGRHVAMHINQAEADKRLAESRQFGAYNRLTAFLMHDLNNLIAQLSLVVKNAEKFRHNPKFVDDAIDTIAHSVSRMKRLMEQLRRGSKAPDKQQTDLRDALSLAVDRCRQQRPVPELRRCEPSAFIEADPDRLATSLEHLIRNAQDATAADGRVTIDVRVNNGIANVTIADTGHGMSPEFIRERLFRPFDSTKGSQRMGIGAYQARDYIRTLGGQLDVTSQRDVGTTFSIHVPIDE